ncbi:beta-mannosidase [Geosmithia morbida]|uniref:Beta-mannosidase B n=1 Tax=Geosmithia morbida TaxID=1094350 RepID=A0A9P4Z047_9HYPO|nr:beta-mannosidase [Geosmithia morbida]KAF4124976.1 beta-mannosidase [Geosmithia morbida]
MSTHTVIPINEDWQFRQANSEDVDDPAHDYLPVSQFPTNVHLDLLHHKLIPDPYIGKNELQVQWVGETAWTYRTTFGTPEDGRSLLRDDSVKAVLALDGLDTFATVMLNGTAVLESDNMFVPQRVDVTEQLRDDEENELVITFDSAHVRGWRLVEEHPEHKWGCWNGDVSRLGVRKAQYHWGWDWGPTLITCGPWRPVNLEIYKSRIADLWAGVKVDDDLAAAQVTARAEIEGRAATVRFDISLNGEAVDSQTVDVADLAAAEFTIEKPELWYPIRYGKQSLYELKATLLDGADEIDSSAKTIGLRKVELVQRPLVAQTGTSFFFKVNNIPIFCGGSDWIPADNFLPRISKERYRDWVRLVAEGNQLMLRVWGGGIYEDEALYEACDQMGILVWQDFMFGCGNYPAWPALRESIKLEATVNVKILRHHPSIVIYAGNNEDYQYRESEDLTYDPQDRDPESWLKTDFPARYIYEKILADVCAELVPDVPYHFGSPFGGKATSDPTVGDIHQWNVWHGTQEKYQDFDRLAGRFVSEFGMEAFPDIRTVDQFLPKGRDDPDRYAQSSTVDFHNKAAGHERRLALYLAENIRYSPDPFEYYIYCTQLIQGECLASAYRLWKRQWKGPRKEYCAGALVWQTNDCYPVTSWSVCDYYLRPKLAYYTVKREMAPISLGIKRREHQHMKDHDANGPIEIRTEIAVWASNLMLDDLQVDCVLKSWDVETGEETYSDTVALDITIPANQSTEIVAVDVPVARKNAGLEARTVVAAYLVENGTQIARYVNWPEPLKYLHLQKPEDLKVLLSDDLKTVSLSAEVPVKGLALGSEDDSVRFSDNLVDLVPGEVVRVGVGGASEGTEVTSQYLGMVN